MTSSSSLFRDRSNSPSLSLPPIERQPSGGSLQHQQSKRHLFPHLDSSEATPSDHSSTYDASCHQSTADEDVVQHRDKGKNRSQVSSHHGGHNRARSTSTPTKAQVQQVAVHFLNKPNGTPLTTIVEQQSYTTLRTQVSVQSGHLHVHLGCLDMQTQATLQSRLLRRKSYTLDETVLREFREIFRRQDQPNSSIEDDFNLADFSPCEPPFPPYSRIQTPPGAPRWPGERDDPNLQQESSRLRRYLQAGRKLLSTRSGPELREAASDLAAIRPRRRASMPLRVGRAYWQPPRSAYALPRGAEQKGMHPYEGDMPPPSEPIQSSSLQPQTPTRPSAEIRQCRLANTVRGSIERPSPNSERMLASGVSLHNGTFDAPSLPRPSMDRPFLLSDLERALATASRQSSVATSMPLVSGRSSPSSQHGLPAVETLECPQSAKVRQREDSTRYTTNGIPLYRPEASSVLTVPSPANSRVSSLNTMQTASSGSLPNLSFSVPPQLNIDGQRRASPLYQTTLPPSRSESRTSHHSAQDHTNADSIRCFRSSVLPILLPVAARHGIITPRPLRLQAPTAGARRPSPRINSFSLKQSRRSCLHRLSGGSTLAPSHMELQQELQQYNSRHPITVGRVDSLFDTQHSKASRAACWRCNFDERGSAGVKWSLKYCFCQPDVDNVDRESRTAVTRVVPVH